MVELKSHPALLIVDMQNAFCHASGTVSRMGLPVTHLLNVVPPIQKLRDASHTHKIPVFFTRMAFDEDYSDSGLLIEYSPQVRDHKGFVRGSWDVDIIDELKPRDDEVVVDKTRNTAFYKTSLEQQLRDLSVNQLLVAGISTNICVESTVRDAFTIGFHTLTVSDATLALTDEEHRASLKTLQHFGGTASVQELVEALEKRR